MTLIDSKYLDQMLVQAGQVSLKRVATAALYVSPNGDDSDGSTWVKAYTTIQAALDAASTDASDHTAINIAPKATPYDINTTGDPTWAANVSLIGPQSSWVRIKNDHASATMVLKLTGKSGLDYCHIELGTSNNGVQVTHDGVHMDNIQFDGEDLTSAATALEIGDGVAIASWGRICDTFYLGNATHMTALKLNRVRALFVEGFEVANCLVGVHTVHADTGLNVVKGAGIDFCGTAIKVDAGSYGVNFFEDMRFAKNTANVDDGVKNHNWSNIQGEFEIAVNPEDLTGVSVVSGAAAFGADTELIAAGAITKPFKIIAYNLAPSDEETMIIRFSADSGSTYFTESVFATKKDKATGGGDATDFIFNAGTRISASLFGSAITRNTGVWLEIQEI